jgi:hypothetical protein
MINITYIYLVEIGNNQVYIGKTVNPKNRETNHKITYGETITYSIIDQVDSIEHKKWKPIETMWIQSFMTWGFDVVNIKKEGGTGSSRWSEQQKQNRKGKGVGQRKVWNKQPNHPSRSKPVLQYDLEGNFIKEWPSIMEARRLNPKGDIDSCVQGKQKQAGCFQWLYKEENIQLKINPYIKIRQPKYKTLEEKTQARRIRDKKYYQKKIN